MDASAIDQIQLSFSPAALSALNGIIAVILFGVALDIRWQDFVSVTRKPQAVMTGMFCQFLLLPAIAWICILLLDPHPSIALGLLLVSACPGGNVSNFLTAMGGGHAALSVSLSGLSTAASIIMTPANFLFWAGLYPPTEALLRDLSLSPVDILTTVLLILVLPTVLGMGLAARYPGMAERLRRPMRVASMLMLAGFILLGLAGNWQAFVQHIGVAFWIVAIVNALGLCCGYGLARVGRLNESEARAVAFETGIQNSGFGLVLCFNHFAGLGGMAMIAAWWGVWHLISGLTLASVWKRYPPASSPGAPGVNASRSDAAR
ncbi:MAG: bile acid:sodium symporter family protein [Abyssibacter sp.]|uniref:bile acid:sodium symporter family protein n=1 Tax=Abyssibacter sp. TaxID=2320200 RepID=UPI00321BCC9A